MTDERGGFDKRGRATRRAFLLLASASAGVAMAPRSSWAATQVPIPLQAELVSKAAKYDRRLPSRVDGELRLLSVYAKDDPDSEAVAILFRNRIRRIGDVGGYPVDAESLALESADDLAERCRSGVAVVYLASGLGTQIRDIAKSLTGVSVLTIASEPRYVPRGVVLGFDLVGGKPKMLVHLTQARAQDVQLRSSLLKLAEIVG